ncbi:uncharacterized protein LOC144549255 isoform X2 [Carex rostrata]
MASKITSSPATGESETQNEHKRPLMPRELLIAAMDGDAAHLNQLLGLNNEEEEDNPPHAMVFVDDKTPMEPSEGMGDTILHILSAYGHENLVSKICIKDSSLLKAHNVRNETPFHHAARFGHENTISKLIRCAKSVFGEDGLIELLSKQNCLGETALHEAARHGYGAVVSTLMEEDIELAGLVNDDSVSPLYLATARGSVDLVHSMVEKLLGQAITPAFYSGPKQQTALFAAVLQDKELITKELLKLYSEPFGKATDETGRTPLHFVASTGNDDIAELLLEKDPSLAYIPDSDGSFPVHTAVRMGHFEMIGLLLQWCPDSGQLLDGNGKNILHIATKAQTATTLYRSLTFSKYKFTTSYLKKMFTRMTNTMDNKGNTPLHLAAEHGDDDVNSLLIRYKGDLTLQNKEGLTAPDIAPNQLRKYTKPTQNEPKRPLMPRKLITAAYLNQLLGLNNEEEDHPQPSKEEHPPHTMVSVDDDTPMELSDSLIRSTTGMGDTILHMLSAYGHEKLVSKICMKDSSLLKEHNVRNETPFHHAARFGHKKTISELISCSKSVFGEDGLKELLRQKNCLGETALHEAARHDHGAVVSILMEEDIELAGLVNDDSVSPLYLATARGSVGMVHNMVEKLLGQEITPAFYSGPKQQTALFAAVRQDTELTEELLKLYSEPLGKEIDETGRTPLHFVAIFGDCDIAELLLEKDPSLAYIPDSDGSFPIHTAVRMGRIQTTRLLLQWCPDPCQLLDGSGKNILHIAIEAKTADILYKLQNDSKDKIAISSWKKWINRMANATDNKGNTPLHLAAEHEDNDVMISLLKKTKVDMTLQNKEGLTAQDIAEIKQEKYYTDPYQLKDIKDMLCGFSRGWFQHYTKEHYTKEQMSKTELIRGTNEDGISTTDTRGAKNSSESVMMKAQFVGLGSVLIATVTFAAAFTLPGGTNQDTGTPILGRKYIFKAFVIADYYAFFCSFLITLNIVYTSCVDKSDMMESMVEGSLLPFTVAAKSMLIALGLGLYLMLAPIGNTGAVVLALSLFSALFSGNQLKHTPVEGMKLDMVYRQLFRGEARCRLKLIATSIECFFKFYPILGTSLIVFLFALI